MRKLLAQCWTYQKEDTFGKEAVTLGNVFLPHKETQLGNPYLLPWNIYQLSLPLLTGFRLLLLIPGLHSFFPSLLSPDVPFLEEILWYFRLPGVPVLCCCQIPHSLAPIVTCGYAPGWRLSMRAEKPLFLLTLQSWVASHMPETTAFLGNISLNQHFRGLLCFEFKTYSLSV